MSSRNYKTYPISLTANQEYPLRVLGNMWAVQSNTGAFSITFDESNKILNASAGMGGEFPQQYENVVLLSTTTQTVYVVLGFGKYQDARSSVNATINTTIAPSNTINNPGDVAVSSTAVLLLAANSDRKVAIFTLPSSATNPVRIGNALVTSSSGDILEPGQSKSFADESAWYAIRETTDETVSVLELERP